MSYANINIEFSEFGRKMRMLGIILVLDFLLSLISVFVAYIGYISWVFTILELYFIFSALKNIRIVGDVMNNRNLHEYRSKWINGFVVRIIGGVLTTIGGVNLINILLYGGPTYLIGIFIVGIIITLIGAYIEMQAWKELIIFFQQNGGMFPQMISYNANRGSNNMKNAALCDILFFLIITPLIAYILRVLGYFKLAKLEETRDIQMQAKVPEYQPQPVYQPIQQSPYRTTSPQPAALSEESFKYCPHCGVKVEGHEKFCGTCGSKLE